MVFTLQEIVKFSAEGIFIDFTTPKSFSTEVILQCAAKPVSKYKKENIPSLP